MPAKDPREVTEYIVQALSQGRSREAVTQEVAQRYAMDIRKAEGLVLRVETAFDRDITARRSPAYLVFSALALLGGVALILFPMVEVVRPLIDGMQAGLTWQQAAPPAREVLMENVPLLLVGVGLIIAGVRGVSSSLWMLRRKDPD